MRPKTNIETAVHNLIEACGFDKSESATEAFYFMLRDAMDNLAGEIEKSHANGLCLDIHRRGFRWLAPMMVRKILKLKRGDMGHVCNGNRDAHPAQI